MRAQIAILTGLVTGLAGLAAPASAQMIRRAENAEVYYTLSVPRDFAESAVVTEDDTLWVEDISPIHVVRLTSEAPERTRPRNGDALPAGTLLFGMTVSHGLAYCPPIDFEAPVSRVQCFTDLDDDGSFDGRFLTRDYGIDSQFLAAFVHALDRSPPVTYEPVADPTVLTTTTRVVLDRVRRGTPEFVRYVDEDASDTRFRCEPVEGAEPGLCNLMGVILRMEALGDEQFRFHLVAAPQQRGYGIRVTNTGLD